MREPKGLEPRLNGSGGFSAGPLGKDVQLGQKSAPVSVEQPPIVLVISPEDIPAKALRLAKSNVFLPELKGEIEVEGLQIIYRHYDREDHSDSPVGGSLYLTAEKVPHRVLTWYLHAPTAVKTMCDRSNLNACWRVLTRQYEDDVFKLASEPEQKTMSPFDKFISYFMVRAFYERVATHGLCDNQALLLLGKAKQCNPKLDIETIYRNAHNSEPWKTKNEQINVEYCKPGNTLDRTKRSAFKEDSVRIFVGEEEGEPLSDEKTRLSYLKVATYYGAARQKRIDPETLLHLREAQQLNSSIDLAENCVEGLRHFFSSLRREILAGCYNLRAMSKEFEGFVKKEPQEQQDLRMLVNHEILQVQTFTERLQQPSYGALGFLESARLYLELLLFIADANNKAGPEQLIDPTIFCIEVLKCLYIAEFLFTNRSVTEFTVAYLDVVRKDDIFGDLEGARLKGDYTGARLEIINYYSGRFFPSHAQMASSSAKAILKRDYLVSDEEIAEKFPTNGLLAVTEDLSGERERFSLNPKDSSPCHPFSSSRF